MKGYQQLAFKYLSSRLARNIYFWAPQVLSTVLQPNSTSAKLLMLVLYMQEMVMVYINNLLLVPQLLTRRRYISYIASVLAIVAIITGSCVYTLKLSLAGHLAPSSSTINVVNGPAITGDMSLLATISQSGAMYASMLGLTLMFTAAWYVNNYIRQQKAAEQAKNKQLEAELQLAKMQAAIEESRKKQVEAELAMLKAQLDPHFLFNTLNNLYGLAIQRSEYAPDAILKLSEILRYLLYNSNTETISVEKEKEVMIAYVELERLRLPSSVDMTFVVEADDHYFIPPLLWLPVLENVFKHGTKYICHNYFIDYRFFITKGQLTISSKNFYDPDEHANDVQEKGIGLSNLKQRLDILFPDRYRMEHYHDEKYFFTNIHVNLS